MDSKRIMEFLRGVAANNNRPWFQEHKAEYDACHADFLQGVTELIKELARFDPEIANVEAKDSCYRFYRDVRFSTDKSPYKRHFGAYISAHGRKGLRGGYYIHMQPDQCLMAVGCYWLPTNILTSCRNEIMGNIDAWRKAVENSAFLRDFGRPGEGMWEDDKVSAKGFGLLRLKTAPKGFPKDYPYMDYLKMKDYCCWHKLADDSFSAPDWAKKVARYAKVAKPMMDIINSVVDDYED